MVAHFSKESVTIAPCNKTSKEISILYQNVRGLKTKLKKLRNNLPLIDNMLIAVSETFLDGSVEDAEIILDGWNLFRRDRETRCGGVMLAAGPGSGINLIRRRDLETQSGEDLWASFNHRGISVYICVVYIPPKAPDSDYMAWFCKVESFIKSLGGKILITGDLNMNSASPDINNYYAYFLEYCNLSECNSVYNVRGGKLDVVLVRECDEPHVTVERDTALLLGLVDKIDFYHPPLDITTRFCFRHAPDQRLPPSNVDISQDWNFRKIDTLHLKSLLAECSWSSVYECRDAQGAADIFYSLLHGVFNQCVPKKKRSKVKSMRYPVWFSADIIADIRKKLSLHQAWKKSNCADDYQLFSDLRADLKCRISVAYDQYTASIESDLKKNPQHFWRHMASLKSKGGFEPRVSYCGVSYEGVSAAEAFAEFFASVFLKDKPRLVIDHSLMQNVDGGTVSIPYISPEEVGRALTRLKIGSSPGPDNLPAFVLKSSRKHLTFPLCYIFNLCLKNGVYPTQWKVSRVTPIPKSSNKTAVDEYRPIAILCSPAKVFEYILHGEIYRQVKQYLCEEQHGFRPRRSVNTNLLSLVDYISKSLDRGFQVDVLYFDFCKAFDKVDNDILLQKLRCIGFTPNLLAFFADYLRDRQQFVKYGIYVSEPYFTPSGVSQGSVLGPLLFLVMINDLVRNVKFAKCLLYADDLKLALEIKSQTGCYDLQNDIDSIYQWSKQNKMFFNPKKCYVMTFDRKKRPIQFPYVIDKDVISRVNTIKDLGVTFDRSLKFNDHVAITAKESYRRLGFVLRNANDFRDPHVIRLLYNTLVRSKLEASVCVWNPYHDSYTTMLEKVQKAFLRNLYRKLYGYYPYLYPTAFLQGQLGFNSLKTRRAFDQFKTCAKILRNDIDSIDLHDRLLNFFVPDNYIRHRASHRHKLFYTDRCRTVARKNNPICRAMIGFNAFLDLNRDCDIFCDKWPAILQILLTFCENDF